MAFDAQVTDLVGGTIDQTACDQWAVDGVREIIMQLPGTLQERCSDKATLSNSPTTLDLDTSSYGKVLYCTRYNGSYHKPCRLVESVNANLVDDSTASNYYATADDPAYFIRDNIVEIKPTPTAAQNGFVYHIKYPTSIDISSVSAIASLPIEVEHVLVLYISTRQLLQYMSSMSADYDDDIEDAFSRAKTLMTDDASFNALASVTDDVTNVSALYQLGQEDTELVASALSLVATELSRASAMMGADGQQYQWYTDQYVKLSGEYAKGIAALKGV